MSSIEADIEKAKVVYIASDEFLSANNIDIERLALQGLFFLDL